MVPEVLAEELDREPFIPLRVRGADGSAVDIRNSGLCFIARLTIYVFNARMRESLAEDVKVISLRNIVSVETLSNGRPRRRANRRRG